MAIRNVVKGKNGSGQNYNDTKVSTDGSLHTLLTSGGDEVTSSNPLPTEITNDYLIEVERGNVEGQETVAFVGVNPSMTADTSEVIWDNTGDYIYLTSDTTLYASSSSASDTTIVLLITGLDDTYTEITRTVTLNGQTQVALSGDMFRIYTAFVTGSTQPLGDIYIAESDTLTGGVPDTNSKIKTKIVQGKNRSNNGFYTIPANKTAYGLQGTFSSPKNVDVCVTPRIRNFNGLFFDVINLDIYQFTLQLTLFAIVITEKSDIEVRGVASNSGSTTSTSFSLILIDN